MVQSKQCSEESPLIMKHRFRTIQRRYRNASKFVTSKESLLTLLLNFSIHLIYYSFISPSHYLSVSPELLAILVNCSISTFLRCSYPLAGYLADNHFGRYRTVFCSLKILKPGVVMGFIGGAVVISGILFSDRFQHPVFLILLSIGMVVLLPGLVLVLIGMIGFKANIIQFGLDQLFDSPWEDQVVYVYWFMWTSFCPRLIIHLLFKVSKEVHHSTIVQYCTIGASIVVAWILLTLLCWMARRLNNWFLISLSSFNPYRLVHLVTKFSMKHKVPVYRSALTYCEDKLPTGLDLGKSKYGGPFTTEQVEDVKVFYGILKVLVAMGPIFTLCYISDPLILVFQTNIESGITMREVNSSNISSSNLEKTGEVLLDVLDQIIVLVLIPIYLSCIRPLISYYTPGVLKKVGLSMAAILCLLAFLVVCESTIRFNYRDTRCIFELQASTNNETISFNANEKLPFLVRNFKYISIIHRTITNILVVIIHVSMYEFVCSQSPHTMKGLLIGVSYAIRACFDIIGPLLAVLLGIVWRKLENGREEESQGWYPSCGMAYYFFAIILGVFCLFLYIYIARGYKYRVRDEVCNVQQYVENYYYKYAGMVAKRKKKILQTQLDITTSGV